MVMNDLDCGRRLAPRSRYISLAECVLGICFVVAHNILHILPNEVYFLVAVGLISLYARNGGVAGVGMRRPGSWTLLVAASLATAMLMQLDGIVLDPIVRLLNQQTQHVSSVMPHVHDLRQCLLALAIVWTFAALGEEIGYRAYLMTRFGEMAGGGGWGKALSLIAASVLFGFGHFYKGPAGIIDSTASGLLLGGLYLLTGNLWAPIIAHGLSDTFAVATMYFGWFS
jgi:membrane protease YdiL (CAAX protease family)